AAVGHGHAGLGEGGDAVHVGGQIRDVDLVLEGPDDRAVRLPGGEGERPDRGGGDGTERRVETPRREALAVLVHTVRQAVLADGAYRQPRAGRRLGRISRLGGTERGHPGAAVAADQ